MQSREQQGPGFYRHLDGVHRWNTYKATGVEMVTVIIKDLAGDDWRSSMRTGGDFQNTPAMAETHKGGILIDDYLDILKKTGWYHTHIIQAPLSSQRFSPVVVSAMQTKGILGVISRYVIVLGQNN